MEGEDVMRSIWVSVIKENSGSEVLKMYFPLGFCSIGKLHRRADAFYHQLCLKAAEWGASS
jgi:hypothetical protein